MNGQTIDGDNYAPIVGGINVLRKNVEFTDVQLMANEGTPVERPLDYELYYTENGVRTKYQGKRYKVNLLPDEVGHYKGTDYYTKTDYERDVAARKLGYGIAVEGNSVSVDARSANATAVCSRLSNAVGGKGWTAANANPAEIEASNDMRTLDAAYQRVVLGRMPEPKEFTVDDIAAKTYSGSALTPTVTVWDGEDTTKQLTLGEDYTVSYSNNVDATTNAQKAKATVSGLVDYYGYSLEEEFVINKAGAVAATARANNRTYDGTEKPLVTVAGEPTGGTMQYALGSDATTAPTTGYTESIPAKADSGTYHVWYKVAGDENHSDSEPAAVSATIGRAPIAKARVTLTQASVAYAGKAVAPGVRSVVLDGKTLAAGTDYTVSYRNNTAPGTATAVVTGRGNYEGTATATFAITLAKPKLTTFGFTSKSSMDARWGKVAGAKGYELQYRVVGSSWKTVTTTGTSKTVKGMKSGQLYDVRVRATAGSVKGPWSDVSRRYFGGVSGVKAKSKKAGTVTASWRKDSKANAGYEVLVRYKKDGAVVAKTSVAAGKTTATVTGLAKGRKVWVEVRPLRKSGGSTYVGVLHGAWGKA